jgi:uncharacterized protein DUF930
LRVFVLLVAFFIIMPAPVMADDSLRFEQSLKKLALPERLEQLCDYTAMIRIREKTDFQPDRAIAGAITEPRVNEHTIEARGGAFRSHKKWYALSFICTANPDHYKVLNFKFTVGEEIPENKWAAYGLWD